MRVMRDNYIKMPNNQIKAQKYYLPVKMTILAEHPLNDLKVLDTLAKEFEVYEFKNRKSGEVLIVLEIKDEK